mmetsp:Transcript_7405/g.10260  ORF Transcript_7405/g.10260 Transcript_7405/m.10260 type:complete len:428 (-) Transcript_7405:42-1325(-)
MGNSGSLLIDAAQKNSTAKARELINSGIEINFRDVKGANALNWAAYNGNLELCMLLVEHGININNQNLAGWTPLHDASQNGHCEVIEFLLGLKNLDLTKKTSNGWSPLHLAASYGQLDAVKLLIEHGMDIHQTSHTGFTPIDVCKSSIKQQVLDFLIVRGTPYDVPIPPENTHLRTDSQLALTNVHSETITPEPSTSPKPSIQISSPVQHKYEEPPDAPPLPDYLKEGILEHSDGRINYAQHYRTTIQDLPTPRKKGAVPEHTDNFDFSVYNYTTRTDSEKNLLSRTDPILESPHTPPTTPQNNNNDPTGGTNSKYTAHLRSKSFSSSPLSIFPGSGRERSKSVSPNAELRRVSTSPDVSTMAELRQRILMYEKQNEQLMKRVIELQQLTEVQQKVINEQKKQLLEKDKKIAHLTGKEEKRERKATT